tara:strand:+ start:6412 stop:7485 length:1074 start_codon:yes stop_codon:yes gene_type:complete
MPSVANIVGTDLTRYKVVKKNQFACNRMHVGRDYRIPMALSNKENPFIVSPAYTVFEIIEECDLLPEYLMMWFSRAEFDRETWFHTDADVRGGLPWDLFCDTELPIPSIEKQLEIVNEYNTITNRISLNAQLNQKLEETAQALYKHWFVDFEFPNEEGEPFKSSGGAMVYDEELDKEIPEGWTDGTLENLYKFQYGLGNKNPDNNGKYPIYGAGGVIGGYDKFNSEDAPVIGHMGAYCGKVVFAFGKHYVTYNGVICFVKEDSHKWFSYLSLLSKDLMSNTRGSSQPFVSYDMLYEVETILPAKRVIQTFDNLISQLFEQIKLGLKGNRNLTDLKDLLLSKMTKVEVEKEKQHSYEI